MEYVCDCCDPKRRKKKPSSEDNSEEEEDVSDRELSDEDEDKNDDDSNEIMDDDSEDSRGLTSREDSPAVDTPHTPSLPAKSSKPLPPGWFGKGRSKKRRK